MDIRTVPSRVRGFVKRHDLVATTAISLAVGTAVYLATKNLETAQDDVTVETTN